MESPDTLRDATIWFADLEHCRQFMTKLRWPDGVVKCPRCGAGKLTWLAKQRVWKCYAGHESPTFSLKTGTIFEDSPIPLEKWLCAAWMLISFKNGISSYEIHRGLGVTQKTGWFMLHRIRLAMQDKGFNKAAGEVEVDETFIGAKARTMDKAKQAGRLQGRGPMGKQIVFRMVERGGKVVVETCRKRELQSAIRDRIEAGSAIFSDELPLYDGLSDDYKHAVVITPSSTSTATFTRTRWRASEAC